MKAPDAGRRLDEAADKPGVAARTTFARAQQYDSEFANALACEIINTIAHASVLSDQPKIMAVRSAETVEALTTVLASIAATDPRFDQPHALRTFAEKLAKRVRRSIAAFRAKPPREAEMSFGFRNGGCA